MSADLAVVYPIIVSRSSAATQLLMLIRPTAAAAAASAVMEDGKESLETHRQHLNYSYSQRPTVDLCPTATAISHCVDTLNYTEGRLFRRRWLVIAFGGVEWDG